MPDLRSGIKEQILICPLKGARGVNMRVGVRTEQTSQGASRNVQRRGEGILAGRMRDQKTTSGKYGGFSMTGMLQGGTSDWVWQKTGKEEEGRRNMGSGMSVTSSGNGADSENAGASASAQRPEATAIYEAVVAGKENPIENMRKPSKVPYEHMAKDGVIEYIGVCFVCDERTNSICLGDVSDPKKVLNIPLSGGGNLKVNRGSLGLLSKAIGMFSPEDVNRILRAIAQDTKIQSMKNEIEDMENSVGENVQAEASRDGEEHDRDMDAGEDSSSGMTAEETGFLDKTKEP